MDKTLSEGILLEYIKTSPSMFKVWDWESPTRNYVQRNCRYIWHYDITAVLKYFEKITWYPPLICWDYIEIWADMIETECIWKIPYKSLHLYTEQEEIQLLELLLKLK